MKQEWDRDELVEYFSLLPDEYQMVEGLVTHNQLGLAILLKVFEYHCRFPQSVEEIPLVVVAFIAKQLDITAEAFQDYKWEGRTIKTHRAIIRERLGFRQATIDDEQEVHRWLLEEIIPAEHRPAYLEEMLYDYLRQRYIEPPTPGQVERLVNSAIAVYQKQFFETTLAKLPEETRENLLELITPNSSLKEGAELDDPKRYPIHDLKAGPGKAAVKNLKRVAARLERIQSIDLPPDLFEGIPLRFVRVYRDWASVDAISHLHRHPPATRYTLLAAFCWVRQRELTDYLVEIFQQLVTVLGNSAQQRVNKLILREARRVYGKQRLLKILAEAMLDNPNGVISEVLYPLVGEEKLRDIVHEFQASDSYEGAVRTKMQGSYSHHYRQSLPHMLKTLAFRSNNTKHQPVLEALAVVKQHVKSRDRYYPLAVEPPLEDVVTPSWQAWIKEKDNKGRERILRTRYELCVLRALQKRVKRKMIWVEDAYRYRNPDEDLPADFDDKREIYYQDLNLPLEADEFILTRKALLAEALQIFNDTLPDNPHVSLSKQEKGWIHLSKLKALPEPPLLDRVKEEVKSRWTLELIDVIKEVDLRIDFTRFFTSLSSYQSLDQETLRRRLLLCLFGLGTNTGLLPASRGRHGESYDNLKYVRKRYIHRDALRQAIAAIVDATLDIRQTEIWGEATTACASDSKKFAARDQNLLTRWHKRYRGPGVMVYWHVDQNSLCIYSQLKSPASSEVASMIEGVLRHCSQMQVEKNYVDTQGQSEVAFAFCHLLGFELLPRIKNIHKQKLYCPEKGQPDAYPNLKLILARPIRWDLIRKYYDQMVRYATALRLGTADAEAILKRFMSKHPQHPIYQALAELGKVIKTIFLCRYLAAEELRREVHAALEIVENLNSAFSFLFYGRSSEFVSNDFDSQEIAMLSLQLIETCLVYVNTLLLQELLAEPPWAKRMTEADWRGLTPLFYRHINPIGIIELDMEWRIPIAQEGLAA